MARQPEGERKLRKSSRKLRRQTQPSEQSAQERPSGLDVGIPLPPSPDAHDLRLAEQQLMREVIFGALSTGRIFIGDIIPHPADNKGHGANTQSSEPEKK